MEKIILDKIKQADMVLVGIGEEFYNKYADSKMQNEDETLVYNKIAELLEGKPYFIVSMCEDDTIYQSKLKPEQIVTPCGQIDEAQWENYTKWLGYTLNRNLCVLELGVGFQNPQLIRWPFEKVVFYNKKAYLIRVNESLYQLPQELADKGIGLKMSVESFMEG